MIRNAIKVMLDSNVILSAIYKTEGIPFEAYRKASKSPYSLVLSDQILVEIQRVCHRKFPQKLKLMHEFLIISKFNIVPLDINNQIIIDKAKIRDITDRPILQVARKAGVEIIVTGDNDFLDNGIITPKILTAAQFISQ